MRITGFLAALTARAAASTAADDGAGRDGFCAFTAPTLVSVQAESAGRIRLTGPPGGPKLAATASAASGATSSALSADFTQRELGPTMVGMSELSGASYWR